MIVYGFWNLEFALCDPTQGSMPQTYTPVNCAQLVFGLDLTRIKQ